MSKVIHDRNIYIREEAVIIDNVCLIVSLSFIRPKLVKLFMTAI